MRQHHWWLGLVSVLCAFATAGCEEQTTDQPVPPPPPQGEETAMAWSLTSDAFQNDGEIPKRYTCDGEDISPALKWDKPPEGSKELALICDDPDAPMGTFTHWVIWGIPPELPDLPEAVPKMENPPAVGGAKQGRSDFGKVGYGGPCPPRGKPHHYHFRLYALDAAIDLKPGSTKANLLKAMEGHILGQAELVGLYKR